MLGSGSKKKFSNLMKIKSIFEEPQKAGDLDNLFFDNQMKKKEAHKNFKDSIRRKNVNIRTNTQRFSFKKQDRKLREMINRYMNEVLQDELINEQTPKIGFNPFSAVNLNTIYKRNSELVNFPMLPHEKLTEKNHKTDQIYSTKVKPANLINSNKKFSKRSSEIATKRFSQPNHRISRSSIRFSDSSAKSNDSSKLAECSRSGKSKISEIKTSFNKNNEFPKFENENIPNNLFVNNVRNTEVNSDMRELINNTLDSIEENDHNICDKRVIRRRKLVDDSLDDEEDFESNDHNFSYFIIHEDSSFKYIWNFLIMLIFFYYLLVSSIKIGFGNFDSFFLFVIEGLFDVIYIIDVFLSFFVTFNNIEEVLITNHKYICLNYLGSFFIFDVLSALPINLVLNSLFVNNNIIDSKFFNYSLFRILKLFKLAKISDNNDTNSNKEQFNILENFNLKSSEQRVVKFLLNFFFSIHVLSCIWIYVGNLDNPNWISQLNLTDNIDIYVASLYFNCTTIFTIGYGDIIPISIVEKIYSIILMTVGIAFYSFAVTSISALITNHDCMTLKYMNNQSILEDVRRKYPKLTKNLYDKILKFINYDYIANKTEKYLLIADLPRRTKNTLLFKMYSKIITNYSFFRIIGKYNNDDLNSRLLLNMKPLRLYKGEYLIKQNDRVNEAIFINSGILGVEIEDSIGNRRLFDLGKNDHFLGDIFMKNNNQPCPINLKVKSKVCEVFLLNKYDLLTILKDCHEIFQEITRVANENYSRIIKFGKKKIKINEILKNKSQFKSDIGESGEKTFKVFQSNPFNNCGKNFQESPFIGIENPIEDEKNLENIDQFISKKDDTKIRKSNELKNKTNFIYCNDIIQEVFSKREFDKISPLDEILKGIPIETENHLNEKNLIKNLSGNFKFLENNSSSVQKDEIKDEILHQINTIKDHFNSNQIQKEEMQILRPNYYKNAKSINIKNNETSPILKSRILRKPSISISKHESEISDFNGKKEELNFSVAHKINNSYFNKLFDEKKNFKFYKHSIYSNVLDDNNVKGSNKSDKLVENFFSIQQDPKKFIINNIGRYEQKALFEKKDKILLLLEKLKTLNRLHPIN
jgi:CRP-like cAMP-binding protein